MVRRNMQFELIINYVSTSICVTTVHQITAACTCTFIRVMVAAHLIICMSFGVQLLDERMGLLRVVPAVACYK